MTLVHTAPPRAAYTRSEVAEILGISITRVGELLRSGELASSKIGHLRRIRPEAIDDLLQRTEGYGR